VDKVDEGGLPGSDRELAHSPSDSGEFALPVIFDLQRKFRIAFEEKFRSKPDDQMSLSVLSSKAPIIF
jgi:hypothetical protein